MVCDPKRFLKDTYYFDCKLCESDKVSFSVQLATKCTNMSCDDGELSHCGKAKLLKTCSLCLKGEYKTLRDTSCDLNPVNSCM